MFPKLATDGIIRTTILPDLRQSILDPLDISRAVNVVLKDNGDKYSDKKLKLGEAQPTFLEIINIVIEVLGDDRVRLEQISEVEAKGS